MKKHLLKGAFLYFRFYDKININDGSGDDLLEKIRASRNRTLTLGTEEEKEYFGRCIRLTETTRIEEVLDKTIHGNTLELMTNLPTQFVDLMIVDPPYNLDKNYNGNDFKKMSQEDYKHYTNSWITKMISILKPTASVYVCCDWRSSMIIGQILSEYFYVQNRITWQREKGRGALSNWKNAMEDIWFATCSKKYTFNVEDVKLRRKVIAPYRVDGMPKDWEETEQGNFRNTYPSNFWDDISIPYWSMP
ncbi:MAG: DNA methyltransferase, partial [Clostridiales bacterium]|nr:DNA methyltransferase [Clostridiales bacterium]